MPDVPKQSKKAIRQQIKHLQSELKADEPKYPSRRVKCKYCTCNFNTPATYNGSKMKFCSVKHQKAFDKEGEKPIDVILRKQERRMREIAREEAGKLFDKINAESKTVRELLRSDTGVDFEDRLI